MTEVRETVETTETSHSTRSVTTTRTTSDPTTEAMRYSAVDQAIVALLPRDWPGQLDAFLDRVQASPYARDAAFAIVDAWVQAAVEAEEAGDADELTAEAGGRPSGLDADEPTGDAFDAASSGDTTTGITGDGR